MKRRITPWMWVFIEVVIVFAIADGYLLWNYSTQGFFEALGGSITVLK